MNSRIILAVDGGNSKTDAVLVTETGELLAHGRGPGSSPHQLGLHGCMRLLDEMVRDTWRQAGLAAHGKADRAEIYLAGADLPVEIAALRAEVDAVAWAAESVVANDAFALLRAGTEKGDAIAVVCGAGINCVGRTASGATAAFPSLGQITGDWGGGRHLGYEALWHATRAEDGRGRATELRKLVPARYGRDTVADVSAAMHFGDIDEARVIELAPVLFAAAAEGDAVATAVVGRLASEIAVLTEAMLDRLSLRDAEVPVVLGGGVLRAQHEVLVPLVARELRAAGAALTVVTGPPVLGAALAGLDALGAGDQAKLRAAEELRTL